MKLQCKHCPEEFHSLDLRPEVALKECGDNLIAHVMSKHVAWAKTGQQKMQAAMLQFIWLVTMQNHTVIPESETQVREMHGKVQENVLKVLGYTPITENKSVLV